MWLWKSVGFLKNSTSVDWWICFSSPLQFNFFSKLVELKIKPKDYILAFDTKVDSLSAAKKSVAFLLEKSSACLHRNYYWKLTVSENFSFKYQFVLFGDYGSKFPRKHFHVSMFLPHFYKSCISSFNPLRPPVYCYVCVELSSFFKELVCII